jgi:hypothetical protein
MNYHLQIRGVSFYCGRFMSGYKNAKIRIEIRMELESHGLTGSRSLLCTHIHVKYYKCITDR